MSEERNDRTTGNAKPKTEMPKLEFVDLDAEGVEAEGTAELPEEDLEFIEGFGEEERVEDEYPAEPSGDDFVDSDEYESEEKRNEQEEKQGLFKPPTEHDPYDDSKGWVILTVISIIVIVAVLIWLLQGCNNEWKDPSITSTIDTSTPSPYPTASPITTPGESTHGALVDSSTDAPTNTEEATIVPTGISTTKPGQTSGTTGSTATSTPGQTSGTTGSTAATSTPGSGSDQNGETTSKPDQTTEPSASPTTPPPQQTESPDPTQSPDPTTSPDSTESPDPEEPEDGEFTEGKPTDRPEGFPDFTETVSDGNNAWEKGGFTLTE